MYATTERAHLRTLMKPECFLAAMNTMSFALTHFLYVPDSVGHRQIEHWPSFAEIGAAIESGDRVLRDDCDGFARLCQWWLATQYGLDSAVLCCLTETDEGHLVCEVGGTPEQGGWVLDNRQVAVTTRERLAEQGYVFTDYAKDGVWIPLTQEVAS